MIQQRWLDKQGSIFRSGTTRQVGTKILAFKAVTTVTLEDATLPSKVLSTDTCYSNARLDEQIMPRRVAELKFQQLIVWREYRQDFRARECVCLAHLMKGQFIVDWIWFCRPVEHFKEARPLS
jgi:hypothetical protein